MNRSQDSKIMIHVHDLWKSYGKFQVLRALFLDVYEGETVVILGRSGAGKSVLLRHMIGIERPDRGYININDARVEDPSSSKRQKGMPKMGMLFSRSRSF